MPLDWFDVKADLSNYSIGLASTGEESNTTIDRVPSEATEKAWSGIAAVKAIEEEHGRYFRFFANLNMTNSLCNTCPISPSKL